MVEYVEHKEMKGDGYILILPATATNHCKRLTSKPLRFLLKAWCYLSLRRGKTLMSMRTFALIMFLTLSPWIASSRGKVASEADILPLAVGNTWTYSKTIPRGKEAFFQRSLIVRQGGYFLTVGTSGTETNEPVSCLETYKVVGIGEKRKSWRVEITATPPECRGKNLRDGRYEDASRIFWEKEPNFSKDEVGIINERIIYDRDKLPPGWKDEVVDPIEEVRITSFVWKVLAGKDQPYISLKRELVGSNIKVSSSNRTVSIKTPAGDFEDCVEVKEDVAIQKGNDKKDPWSTGWTNCRYLCLGIGLVKEFQKTQSGDVLYFMELIKYHLVSSPP